MELPAELYLTTCGQCSIFPISGDISILWLLTCTPDTWYGQKKKKKWVSISFPPRPLKGFVAEIVLFLFFLYWSVGPLEG